MTEPGRGLCLRPTSDRADVDGITIVFTTDGKVVLGLLLDKPRRAAAELLGTLVDDYGCAMGVVTTEQPAPSSQAEPVAGSLARRF